MNCPRVPWEVTCPPSFEGFKSRLVCSLVGWWGTVEGDVEGLENPELVTGFPQPQGTRKFCSNTQKGKGPQMSGGNNNNDHGLMNGNINTADPCYPT